MSFDWDTADARARDAWIAMHIMVLANVQDGRLKYWFTPTDSGYTPRPEKPREHEGDKPAKVYLNVHQQWVEVPHFTTDAAADYLVLERVREWGRSQQESFYWSLINTWIECAFDEWPAMGYRPGDYSHAAYLALQETER